MTCAPLLLHVVLDQLGQLPVEERQDLRQHLDHGDLDAGQVQGLAGLDADQPAADDDRVLDLASRRGSCRRKSASAWTAGS